MSKKVSLPDAGKFNLASFAEILPSRAPIIGEDPGSFDVFHEGLMRSLAPLTPYECVIAENLVAIEWELLQRRRMREAAIRRVACAAIEKAVFTHRRTKHMEVLDEARERHHEDEGAEADWDELPQFDLEAAEREGADLAARATSSDRTTQQSACEEIAALGMDAVEVMSAAYTSVGSDIREYDLKVQELERRRREVNATSMRSGSCARPRVR